MDGAHCVFVLTFSPGPDPDLKSDRCIIDYKTTNLNAERRRCEIWLGGPGHAPLENFVLINAGSCIFLHSDV